jgi:hypothetical protein
MVDNFFSLTFLGDEWNDDAKIASHGRKQADYRLKQADYCLRKQKKPACGIFARGKARVIPI